MPSCLRRSAFTLTEILIVIALIVLILAMAMPAFNFITGSRSEDAAMNQISAFLARARTEAVGLQEIRGVMFYIDPATDREMMVLVQSTPSKAVDSTTNPNVEVWLGLEPDADQLALPRGIGIQTLNDSGGANRDQYIGFNAVPGQTPGTGDPKIGGVILFDGYGKLTSKAWGFRMTDAATATGAPNGMGQLVFPAEIRANSSYNATDIWSINAPKIAPQSTFGFVVFDRNIAEDRFGTDFNTDLSYVGNTTMTGQEPTEESWLGDNATPVMINRYNGTLLKSE